MAYRQPWHARLYSQAYSDFSVPEPLWDRSGYWTTVTGQIAYRAGLFLCWVTLNCVTLWLGVFVEPLWRRKPLFRRLQLAGKIPLIGVIVPVIGGYAAFRTVQIYGFSHAILPFLAVAGTAAVCVAVLSTFNGARRGLHDDVDEATDDLEVGHPTVSAG